MLIRKLRLSGFRNLKDQIVEFSEGKTALVLGDNGQGKSSLIEAIWLFSCAKSFRGAADSDMIAFGRDEASLKALVDCEGVEMQIGIRLARGKRKEITIGSEKLKRSADLVGNFITVLFEPDHLSFVSGGPDKRRRGLDISLCQCSRGYTKALSEYNRILASRTALLKGGRKPGAEETLSVWDEALAERGARVIAERGALVRDLSRCGKPILRDLSGGREELSLQYTSPFYREGASSDEIRDSLLRALNAAHARDFEAGATTVGPHRDDLEISIGGLSARRFASTGQKRSAVVALKLAECEVLKERLSARPVFLLDDVLSELDPERCAFICERIGQYQVILTDCSPRPEINGAQVFRVAGGLVEEA